MRVGLRIDVDTFRGTKLGVPNLCRLLAEHSILATFYFSVGPDNMGRHLWRLLKPSFLVKMLRSNAPGLYGWDIILRGTFIPGAVIGDKLANVIRDASSAGHEMGFHAWDHHAWQARLETMSAADIRSSLEKGVSKLTQILGKPPVTSAVPGWKCTDLVLTEKSRFPFTYNSDCRGTDVFTPLVNGKPLTQPQVPVNLPTYDEVIGRNGITDANYNDYILSLIDPAGMNGLTIHAEVEGIARHELFRNFIKTFQSKGGTFVPLGTVLSERGARLQAPVVSGPLPGREGWVAHQGVTGTAASAGPTLEMSDRS